MTKYSIDILVLEAGSVVPFVTPAALERYYVFLLCSQEKRLHFHGENQEISGEDVWWAAYEHCV